MLSTRLSDDTLATVLTCGGLSGKSSAAAPLTHAEWNRLVQSMIRASWRPGDLLRWGVAAARDDLALDHELATRLEELLGQAMPVAIEIERLSAAGIGILSRADEAYPSRWRSKLREQSPPLLFVAGPVSRLEAGGIAAIGSREVDEAGAKFARAAGRSAARAGAPMISGGARGVDREAIFGALEAGGDAVGIMPDGLARALRSPDVRKWVADGQLVLASPHRPNSRFEVWKAMGRNKLIYAMADVSIVVSSDAGRGGTWSGATENLRHGWSPLFVRTGTNVPEGNRQLLERGAMPIDERELDDSRPGSLVTRLLASAERANGTGKHHPMQRPLLDDDGRFPIPTPVLMGTSRFANGHDVPEKASNMGQLDLGKEF